MGCGGSKPKIVLEIEQRNAAHVRDCIRSNPNVGSYKTPDNQTVLHIAARYDTGVEAHCMEALMEAPGVKTDVVDKDGDTALHVCAKFGSAKAMKYLLRAGASVVIMDRQGRTPLHLAVELDQVACVQSYVDVGVSLDVKDNSKQTPMHIAAETGHQGSLDVLLTGKVVVGAQDKDGLAPLHKAAESGHLKIVEALLKAKADPQLQDNRGRVPLQLAEARGHRNVAELLGGSLKEEDAVRVQAAVGRGGGSVRQEDPNGLHPASDLIRKQIQELMNVTWKGTTTRDRAFEKVHKFEVVQVLQNVNKAYWAKYTQKREDIALHFVEKIVNMKTATTALHNNVSESFKEEVNEFFLFHGTKPNAAMNICEKMFRVDLSGSHKGSLYGPGIYFAEASSKADEYAGDDKDGLYKGLYAMLLCRVTVGNAAVTYDVTPDVESLGEMLEAESYHSILGDREAIRGTYREFVIRDAAQAYPAYVIIYRRTES